MKKKYINFSPSVIAAMTLVILVYCTNLPVRKNDFTSLIELEDVVEISGQVTSNPSKTQSGKYYSVSVKIASTASRTESSSAAGTIQLLIPTSIVEAMYPGKLFSKVSSVGGKSVPIIENGLMFSGKVMFLAYDEITKGSKPLFILDTIDSFSWINNFAKIRAMSRLEFKRLLYAWGDAGGLLLALLSGSREYTNRNLAEAFRLAGLSHVLALSGMHLSLFAGLAFGFGNIFGGKKIGTYISLVAVLIFVWFAGLSPSLFRAFLCTLITLVLEFSTLPGVSGNSEAVFRFISPSYSSIRLLRVLSVAFIIHICISPMDAYNAGFMLSYGALIGIALFEYITKPVFVRFKPQWLASSLTASIGAQFITAPITFSLFGTIMPIGIISSVVVSPLALGFLVIGFIFVCISIVLPFLLDPLGQILAIFYNVIDMIVMWFAQFPPIS